MKNFIKILFVLIVTTLFSKTSTVFSQEIKEVKKSPVLTIVEIMPKFKGGEQAMYKWLSKKIKYPKNAKENEITGTVIITFVIEKNGSVSNVEILKGIGGGCEEEALRVIKLMPKWKPGKQSGVPVRVQFNLPIIFTLE
ncbi:MAG: energy transducer TonB [Bacteroidales bacterium]